MITPRLTTAALAGAARSLEIGSYKMRQFDFKVLNAKHRIQEIYEIKIVASAHFL
ncbi:MAG: hypothetical protein GKR94_26785 [Gammaproteobacteria bacterium]|nr:hypothetical protein [Gammaproteobacteria bacterium]